MTWLRKLQHLLDRRRQEETIEEEMRLHLEERVDDLIASGQSPDAARVQARREFGSTARAGEDSRDAWRWRPLEDFFRDLRYAARSLARDKGLAITAIVSLALGIGANTTIFSLTMELLFSRPSVANPETLMQVQLAGGSPVPLREFRFLQDAKIFGGLTGVNPMQEVNWRTSDVSQRLFATRVIDNFFEVTGTPVAMGRPLQKGDRFVALIGHGFWQNRLHGDSSILGKSITLDGQPHTIVGVLPAGHRTLVGFGYTPDLYLPIVNQTSRAELYGRLAAPRPETLARLKSSAAELDRVFPDRGRKWADKVTLLGLAGVERLREGMIASISVLFALLLGVVGLLLLIACVNVASLLLARSSTRVHEFAIRMSIGAGRERLIRQLLTETLVLSLAGTAAGLALNLFLTFLMNTAVLPAPFPMRLAIQPDTRLLIYAALIAVGTALVAGLLPALKSTRGGTNLMLKEAEHQVSGSRAKLRNLLVTSQLALSVLVLIMAALSIRNLVESATLDPGFDLHRTVWAQVRLVPGNYGEASRVRELAASAVNEIRAMPGVETATVAMFVPLNDHFVSRSSLVYTDRAEQGIRIEHWWNYVGPEYFRTMSIGMIAGREFTPLDREGSQMVVVINEAFARQAFGSINPIGRMLRLGTNPVERMIVGVVKNSKYSSIGEKNRPAMFEPYMQLGGARAGLNFLVKTNGSPELLTRPLQATLLRVDASSSIETKPMSRAIEFALLPSRAGATMLGTIGLLGLLLSSVGLYGVLSYSSARRTREIGLRVALGAQNSDVVRLVLKEGAWILATGIGAGVALAVLVTRPLARFLVPGLSPVDPFAYAAVICVLIAVGTIASLSPALRALRVDPISALRYE